MALQGLLRRIEAAQHLLGLHERTVGGRHFPVAHLDGHGFRGERQRLTSNSVAAGLKLGIVGPHRSEDRHRLGTLIEHLLGVEIDQADVAHGDSWIGAH